MTPPKGFSERLRGFARTTLARELRQAGLSWIEISAANTACEEAIQRAFADNDLQYDDQWVYRNPAAGWTVEPRGEAVRLSEAAIANGNEESIDVVSRIAQFWGSVDKFYETGIGYGVVENGMIAALCMSGFVDGTVHTVEIETAERYHRRGHALSAASHFIADCVGKGHTVHWDCTATNEASWRLAERLGLSRIAEYRCYCFKV
jgi:hypothetical protein